MLDKYYHTKDAYYTHEKMVAFLRHELEDYERRAMEKLIEEDPFLKDAIEGIKMAGLANTNKAVQRLSRKTDILTGVRKPSVWSTQTRTMAIAAMFLVFLAVSWALVTQVNWQPTSQTAYEVSTDSNPNRADEPNSKDAGQILNNDSGSLQEPEKLIPTKKTIPGQTEASTGPTVVEPFPLENEEKAITEDDYTKEFDEVYAGRSSAEDINENKKEITSTVSKKSQPSQVADTDDVEATSDAVFLSGTPAMAESENQVFTIAEKMPQYPGGNDALYKYLSKNLEYPATARDHSIQGTVYASFIVETDGSLTDVKIIRGLGYGLDEETLRVIRQMPAWKPGKQNGKSVRVLMTLPVHFSL